MTNHCEHIEMGYSGYFFIHDIPCIYCGEYLSRCECGKLQIHYVRSCAICTRDCCPHCNNMRSVCKDCCFLICCIMKKYKLPKELWKIILTREIAVAVAIYLLQFFPSQKLIRFR